MKRAVDGSVQPRMITTRAQRDEILLVLDIVLLRVVQRVVVLDVVSHATVFRVGRTIRRQQSLRRVYEDG